jgi:hypothetical protein
VAVISRNRFNFFHIITTIGKLLSHALKKDGMMDAAGIAVSIQEQTTDSEDVLNKNSKKNQGAQIRALTEMEKLYGITSDSIFYNMASSEAATASAAALYDIKKVMYKIAGKYLGTDEFDDPDKTAADAADAAIAASGTKDLVDEAKKTVQGMSKEQVMADYASGGASKTIADAAGITDATQLAGYLKNKDVSDFIEQGSKAADEGASQSKLRAGTLQDDSSRAARKKSLKEDFAQEHPIASMFDFAGFISSGGIGAGAGYAEGSQSYSEDDKKYFERMQQEQDPKKVLDILNEWEASTGLKDEDIQKKRDQYGFSLGTPSTISDIRTNALASYDGGGTAILHNGETVVTKSDTNEIVEYFKKMVLASNNGGAPAAGGGTSRSGVVVHTVNVFDAVNVQEFMRMFDQKQVFNDKRASLLV